MSLTTVIQDIEKQVGNFSAYETVGGKGEDIPYDLKPAQQFLTGLGGVSDSKAHLSSKLDKSFILSNGNHDVAVASFAPNQQSGKLTISGERVDRLVKSAKTYVNTELFPEGLYAQVMQSNSLTAQDSTLSVKANFHWQNLAVGVCHAQEIDLLVSQDIKNGRAIASTRVGVINKDEPAILLLSSPALNFAYGTAENLTKSEKKQFIKGMYRNLFNATVSEGREYIAMPAAGLGIFGGEPDLYFKLLMDVAKEYPKLNVIYHPAQFGKQFDEALNKAQLPNVVRATKDVLFIADELTKNGKPCAFHNPSDADVVFGVYDVGEYWKSGKGAGYIGEEHIGAMTTAPLNSIGLNPQAYSTVVEQNLSLSPLPELKEVKPTSVKEPEKKYVPTEVIVKKSEPLSYEEYYKQQMEFINRYASNNPVLEDKDRIDRIKKKQNQQSIYFLNDFLSIDEKNALATTQIGYHPLTGEEILAPSKIHAEGVRGYSRQRLVYGPVDFYLGNQFKDLVEIPVITACAPNLMGSSATDLNQFSSGTGTKRGTRQLKTAEYTNACNQLAEFIVVTTKNQEKDKLIMPGFGVGVYINTLNKSSQAEATRIMYQAFAQAANKHQLQIDWIIWGKETKFVPATLANTLNEYSSGNKYMKPVIADDMLEYSQKAVTNGEKAVMLNPGSDRTIGGKYIAKNPKTLEEQIAQQSDLVLLHSTFNAPMVQKFNDEFSERKQAVIKVVPILTPLVSPVIPAHAKKDEFNQVATLINQVASIGEHPRIILGAHSYKVSFKDNNKAQLFVNFLLQNNITSHSNPGQAKQVLPTDNYHIVILTSDDYSKLVKVLNKPIAPKIQDNPAHKLNPDETPKGGSLKNDNRGKYQQNLQDVNALLNDFETKIGEIGVHHSQAKNKANSLLKALQQFKVEAFSSPTDEKLAKFSGYANKAIAAAIPDLQKDLGWGDYLKNMVKQLVNVLTRVVTLGFYDGFFAIKSSSATLKAQDLDRDLQELNLNNLL